ncbi:MAG: translocation/assembly module TamB domain-containing protein [Betaproteobacteria bacterium]|nr:translocation/assembly module TamB domain-containing protein [Betaproteobacteria bacterium]
MDGAPDRDERAPRPAGRRWARVALAIPAAVAIVAVALAGAAFVFLGTQAALDLAVREIIARSEGRLAIEGAEGSLLSTVRVGRITWTGPESQLEAHDVALDWSPLALVERRVHVRGLGARTVVVAVKGSDTATPPPTALVLPFPLTIDRVAVGRLDWVLGPRSGHVRGLAFGYSASPSEHRIRDLAFVFDRGTLSANATLGATAPLALAGELAFAGDASLAGIDAKATLGGTLADVAVDASGRARGADLRARAALTPFARSAIASATVDLAEANLAAIDAQWPATAIDAHVTLTPTGRGFAGTLEATNRVAGAIDAGGLPLGSLNANYAADDEALALDGIVATLPGGGTARGRASVALASSALTGTLDVANVDLARIHGRLVTTRIAGRVDATLDANVQRVRADLADRSREFAAAFDATIAGRRVTLSQLRATAGDARLAGEGTIALDEPLAFDVRATLSRFDPSRFGAFPKGSLDGRVSATGALAAPWRADIDASIADGSRLSGVALAGTARGRITGTEARDVAVDARVAGVRVVAKGNAGRPGDAIAFDVDLPKLDAARPLADAWLPTPLEGRLAAKGTVSLVPGNVGIDARVQGERLRAGAGFAAAKLDARVAWTQVPGVPLGKKPIELDLDARDVVAAGVRLASIAANVRGTSDEHRAVVRARIADNDVETSLAGAFDGETMQWRGALEAFRSSGRADVRLEAPAKLELARDRVALASARLRFADGEFRVDDLLVEQGRITSHGAFTGVPAETIARLAGTSLPFTTDVAFGGAWSIEATPRLGGTISIRRERGDVRYDAGPGASREEASIGLSRLDLDVRFADDAIDGSATLASARSGSATLAFAIAPSPTAAPGTLRGDAPLTARFDGEWPSLKLLQPWLGTTAIADGRLRVALEANGTLGTPVLAGKIAGEALRFDAPQWGLHFGEGAVAATIDQGAVTLDGLSFRAGDGTFRASGTLARARREGEPEGLGTKLAWTATRLRVLNRPDRRIVATGEGTLALVDGRLAVLGSVSVDEGRIEHERTPGATLSPDVVVRGRPPATASRDERLGNTLALALDVDLGNRLSFAGEGLEADLGGRLRIASAQDGRLEARGVILATHGTYYAFGQRLDLDRERARLVFDGPLDNPALDILAIRANLPVEVGVELTGSVRVPRVRLVSSPAMPDGEKLAWLITGRGLDRSTGADISAISAASSLLFGVNERPYTTTMARQFGLDDVSFRSQTALTAGGQAVANAVVAFNKRLNDRLSLVYEQGITVATNVLRLEYTLTQSITLRAETGTASGLGIAYRRSFD